MYNTDQSKDSVGNYIVSLETLDELVGIIESKCMILFEFFSIDLISIFLWQCDKLMIDIKGIINRFTLIHIANQWE